MPTRRHKRSTDKDSERCNSLIREISKNLRAKFPKAQSWVIFSSVAVQRETPIKFQSERLDNLDRAYRDFLSTQQITITDDMRLDIYEGTNLEMILSKCYVDQQWGTGQLCTSEVCGERETLIGHEYFFTEK